MTRNCLDTIRDMLDVYRRNHREVLPTRSSQTNRPPDITTIFTEITCGRETKRQSNNDATSIYMPMPIYTSPGAPGHGLVPLIRRNAFGCAPSHNRRDADELDGIQKRLNQGFQRLDVLMDVAVRVIGVAKLQDTELDELQI